MALLDLLGRRWALRVLFELRAGPLTFRALRDACDGVSPTVLNDRLKELRESRFVSQAADEGYALTQLGRELGERFVPLDAWADKWAKELRSRPAKPA
jgi:DNA-binding HxlR family transcriptional regulator